MVGFATARGVRPPRGFRRARGTFWWRAAAAVGLVSWVSAADALEASARPDGSAGVVRGLVIGADSYRTLTPLRGAVADAQDIAEALRRSGAVEIEVLTDAEVTKAAVMASFEKILARTSRDDLVAITFAGLGALLAEEPGPRAEASAGTAALLFPAFDPSDATERSERLTLDELSAVQTRIAARGARSLLVVDSCFGSDLPRVADLRSAPPTYRCVASAHLGAAAPPDGAAIPKGRLVAATPRSLVLMAAEIGVKVPEVSVPGASGRRGALSFAVARGLEGRADLDGDGVIHPQELSAYVGQVAYQLADQRQRAEIAADAHPSGTARTRGFIVVPRRKDQVQLEGEGQDGWDLTPDPPAPSPAQDSPADPAPAADTMKGVAVAVIGGTAPSIAPGTGRTPIRFVEDSAQAEVVWDIAAREVIARGDTVAVGVGADDIQDVVDRLAVVESLKVLGASNPEDIKVVPHDGRHPADAGVTIRIGTGGALNLVVFNLAGDGTIQLLYPLRNDPRMVKTPFTLPPTVVRPPFGSDCLVAVTSRTSLRSLERALKELDGKRAPLPALKVLRQSTPRHSRIGFATLFTGS